MRVFLSVLILIFSFQSWTKADNVSQFEIEGMSVGDSLLQYMRSNEIVDNGIYESNSKFFETNYTGKLSTYDFLLLHVIRNDPNYIIHTIRAVNIVDNKNECLDVKKRIVKDMKNIFSKNKFEEGSQKHYFYKNSTQYISQFYLGNVNTLESSMSRVECVIMDKKDLEIHGNIEDTLEVIIYSEEFAKWLENL